MIFSRERNTVCLIMIIAQRTYPEKINTTIKCFTMGLNPVYYVCSRGEWIKTRRTLSLLLDNFIYSIHENYKKYIKLSFLILHLNLRPHITMLLWSAYKLTILDSVFFLFRRLFLIPINESKRYFWTVWCYSWSRIVLILYMVALFFRGSCGSYRCYNWMSRLHWNPLEQKYDCNARCLCDA